MNRGYAAALLALVATVTFHGEAQSQPPLPSLSCFYECKPGPIVDGKPTLREITTLMIGSSIGGFYDDATTAGMMLGGPVFANIRIYDGHSNLRAETSTALTANDLDEINICATLRNAGDIGECIPEFDGPCQSEGVCCPGLECQGVNGSSQCVPSINGTVQGATPIAAPVPEAGLIRIDLDDGFDRVAPGATANQLNGDGPPPPSPVHVWVKNLLGRFFVERDEPFEGRVTGVAKTQCMVGPPSELRRVNRPGVRVRPVLVENTDDDDDGPIPGGFPCSDIAQGPPVCDGDCPPGFICEAADATATTSGVGTGCRCFAPR